MILFCFSQSVFDRLHFQYMDHLKFGGCLCSPPQGTDSWHCSTAHINLLCLPELSSLISLLVYLSAAVSGERRYALH